LPDRWAKAGREREGEVLIRNSIKERGFFEKPFNTQLKAGK
jgi:hypothetical protein